MPKKNAKKQDNSELLQKAFDTGEAMALMDMEESLTKLVRALDEANKAINELRIPLGVKMLDLKKQGIDNGYCG